MLPDIVVGASVVALGLLVAVKTSEIAVSPSYSFVSPRVFPFCISALLVALGVGLIVSALFNRHRLQVPDGGSQAGTSRAALYWVVAGLAANLSGLMVLGFIPAAALQYALTARGFGSRRPIFDTACGIVLSTLAYLLFSRVLGLNIPLGPAAEVFA